jgi:hypothetical protein
MRVLLAFVTIFALMGPIFADGTAKQSWPSIVYYGDGINERIDGALYWEGQQGRIAEEARRGSHPTGVGYGLISNITGRPRTNFVSGYTRKDGVSVRPYYRSKR